MTTYKTTFTVVCALTPTSSVDVAAVSAAITAILDTDDLLTDVTVDTTATRTITNNYLPASNVYELLIDGVVSFYAVPQPGGDAFITDLDMNYVATVPSGSTLPEAEAILISHL